MTEAFQSSVHLAGDSSVDIIESLHDILGCLTPFRNMQVLHGNHLGDGKTVVHFAHADLLSGILDAGFRIGVGGGNAGGHEMGAVPGVADSFFARANRHGQRLDLDQF